MHIYKKRPKNGGEHIFVWIAVDRQSGKVIDFEVGDRSKGTYLKLAFRLEKTCKIEHLSTDDYSAYKSYKISKQHHVTKAETALVESKNSLTTLFSKI